MSNKIKTEITRNWEKTYPSDDGWMRMEFTLTKSEMLSEEDIRKLAGWGDSNSHEVPEACQRGRKLTVIARRKRTAGVAAE